MNNGLSDFLTRLLAIRQARLPGPDTADDSIEAFYRFLHEMGVEHCNFGGFETAEDGTPLINQFAGTRLSSEFIEEFSEEMSADDYVMRRGETLGEHNPVAKFDIGLPYLDEIEAFHAPSRRVQVECARQGIEEGVALIGNTSIANAATKTAKGRHFGFVFAGATGTRRVLSEHGNEIEIASFALLDQVMPQVEALMDGYDQPLTQRECDVLRALAEGEQRKQIAFRLSVSLPTVDLHLANLKRKLSAQTLAEAVAKGYRYALI